MSKEFRNHVLKSAIIGCALPTGVINGLLAYFTGHAMTFSQAAMDMIISIAAVAFIVTLIVYPLMRKFAHTLPEVGAQKQDLSLFKSLPTGIFPLSLTLTLIMTVAFALIPTALLYLAPMPAEISVLHFALFKAVYTGIVAAFVNYISTTMSRLTAPSAQANQ